MQRIYDIKTQLSLSEFIDWLDDKDLIKDGMSYVSMTNQALKFTLIYKYNNFLKQPLELRMLVPCDEEGNVLKIPAMYSSIGIQEKYQKAKERVLYTKCDSTIVARHLLKRRVNILDMKGVKVNPQFWREALQLK